MPSQTITVLLIEDNHDHAALIRHHLEDNSSAQIVLEHVSCLAAGCQRLESGGIDAVLLDLTLPDSSLDQSLPKVLAAANNVPVIVLTSLDDMELARAAVYLGAQDYLIKANMNREVLVRSLRYAIERKRAQEEAQRYADELERRNQELDQFANIVSHDLKSPLSVITYACEILRMNLEQRQDAEDRELVGRIATTAKRMGNLIDDILQYARLGISERAFHDVDCRAVFQEALSNLETHIEETRAVIHAGPLPTVTGDSIQFVELFQNLVANAIKYHRQLPPEIEVSSSRMGDFWQFSIRDNGIGIPADQLQEIFLPFKRLHRDDEIPGTGIGLAACKKIVERHGGRIWAESALNQGSVFYFTVPVS